MIPKETNETNKKINKIESFVPDHSRKEIKTQIINGRNVRGACCTLLTNNKRTVRRHCEQLDVNKFDNLDK